MNKSKLENFIKKYYLGATNEMVKIESDGKDVSTSFITDDKSLMGIIKGKGFDLEEFEVGINDTSKLRSLLGILSEDITFSLNKEDDKAYSVSLSDKETDVIFMLADMTVIPSVPKLKALPDFTVEIPLNKDFISKFIKTKNALSEVDTFTLIMDKKKKLNFVVGYAGGVNSNCVSLAISPKDGKDTVSQSISFSAKYLKEILLANSDVEQSVLYVSDKGLAKIQLNTPEFETTYYLVEIKMG